MAWLTKHNLPYIDLVWAQLYDLRGAIDKGQDEKAVRAATDMGGVALLRSGAKGRRLVSPSLRVTQLILEWFKAGRPNEAGFRTWLAWIAEDHCHRYCQLSAQYLLASIGLNGGIPDCCPPLFADAGMEDLAKL
jgi:AICAR transformylase/IMP cyclohydrolase PurH